MMVDLVQKKIVKVSKDSFERNGMHLQQWSGSRWDAVSNSVAESIWFIFDKQSKPTNNWLKDGFKIQECLLIDLLSNGKLFCVIANDLFIMRCFDLNYLLKGLLRENASAIGIRCAVSFWIGIGIDNDLWVRFCGACLLWENLTRNAKIQFSITRIAYGPKIRANAFSIKRLSAFFFIAVAQLIQTAHENLRILKSFWKRIL